MRTFGVRSPTPALADVGCSCGCLVVIVFAVVWFGAVWLLCKAFL
jgi:hypothetical protein